tara:strand:+ start:840 stop:1043 length:204 start_codon:yes stop_codon:yes gene_type:complete
MNRKLQEDYEYHQNAKWDYIQELKDEHHDPFADCEDEQFDQELIEQLKKDGELDGSIDDFLNSNEEY